MSNLSQFFGSGGADGIELEIWIVGAGGGGGASGNGVRGGPGGAGGVFYDKFMVPLGSYISTSIGAAGAAGEYISDTDRVNSGLTGGRTRVFLYDTQNFTVQQTNFGKAYSVAGGGGGGYAGTHSGRGGDGGCGGSRGAGTIDEQEPTELTYTNAYRQTIGKQNASGQVHMGLSYYRRKSAFVYANNDNLYSNTGYLGYDALTSSLAGGVMMPIPALLNQSDPAYYNDQTLWAYDYDPHNDVPIISIPGNYTAFNGFANTGNGGGGGPTNNTNGVAGCSGFVLIRYPSNFDTISTGTNVKFVTNNTYNVNLRAYIITGTVTFQLPSS
jgi:hypothetical protein